MISREWGKDRKELTTSGTYPWSFVTQIFHNCQPSHGSDRKIVMTSTLLRGTLDSVASLLAAINCTNLWTSQWPNDKRRKNKQSSTNHFAKESNDWTVQTTLKIGVNSCNYDPEVIISTSLCCEVYTIKRMWHLFVFLWWLTLSTPPKKKSDCRDIPKISFKIALFKYV